MEYLLLFMMIVCAAAAVWDGLKDYAAIKRMMGSGLRSYIIIPITNGMTDAELVLREALKAAACISGGCRVIMCSMGADREILSICQHFADEHSFFELCTGNISEEIMEDLQKI